MSLHFNLNLNFELTYDTPKDIIELFQTKMKGLPWSKAQKSVIPFNFEIEYLFDTEISQREMCLQTFHFQKQDYLQFPKFRELENDFYNFHLSRTIGDDGFYQGCYHLIVWLAQYSRTNSFIGEYHETESNEVKLLFVKNGEVTVQKISSDSLFSMSPKDFDLADPDIKKSRTFEMLENAISGQNYEFAKHKIEQLIEWYPENKNYRNIKMWLDAK